MKILILFLSMLGWIYLSATDPKLAIAVFFIILANNMREV